MADELEAIRARNEERKRPCGCNWQSGGLDEMATCEHRHQDEVESDIDTLLAVIDELRREVRQAYDEGEAAVWAEGRWR